MPLVYLKAPVNCELFHAGLRQNGVCQVASTFRGPKSTLGSHCFGLPFTWLWLSKPLWDPILG